MKFIDRQFAFIERQLTDSATSIGIDIDVSGEALVAIAFHSDDPQSELKDLCDNEAIYLEACRLKRQFSSKEGLRLLVDLGNAQAMAERDLWWSRTWETSEMLNEWLEHSQGSDAREPDLAHRVLCDFALFTGIASIHCAEYLNPNKPAALGGRAKDLKTGSFAKRAAIRDMWASGKYSSRDICAEQECAALGMSFSTARKSLRGTPDPA